MPFPSRFTAALCIILLIGCSGDKNETSPNTDTGTPTTVEFSAFGAGPTLCDEVPVLFTGSAADALAGQTLSATLTLDGVPSSFDLQLSATATFAIDASVLSIPLSTLCSSTSCTLAATLSIDTGSASIEAQSTLPISDDRLIGHLDADEDGFGTGPELQLCPDGTTLSSTNDDCDDNDDLSYPGAPERCDGIDNDCDANVDNDLTFVAYFVDTDGDGFGAGAPVESTCNGPSDPTYVENPQDCGPTNPDVYPQAPELCDGLDNDCDGGADDLDPQGPIEGNDYYRDNDNDGFFSATAIVQCAPPAGSFQTTAPTPELADCDDSSSLQRPDDTDGDGASTCAGDCDGDDPALNLRDDDSDAFTTCAGDCDDNDNTYYPGAYDIPADDLDQSCDGYDDCYIDDDGDNLAADTTQVVGANLFVGDRCTDPFNGFTDSVGDCDDSNRYIAPGAPEIVGDGIDQDCDDFDVCFVDTDDDNFAAEGAGVAAAQANLLAGLTCTDVPFAAPFKFDFYDCNDLDSTIHPNGNDIWGDDIDQNCDGYYTCYTDNDNDSYHDGSGATVAVPSPCSTPGNFGTVPLIGQEFDCAPIDGSIHPGATEVIGNNIDDDCDGQVACYDDLDNDGYGDPGTSVSFYVSSVYASDCVSMGAASIDDDCDATDGNRYPGAPEIACDGIQQDCGPSPAGDARVAILYNEVVPSFSPNDVTFDGTNGEQLTQVLAAAGFDDLLMLCNGDVYEGHFVIDTPVHILGQFATLDGGDPSPTPTTCGTDSTSVVDIRTPSQVSLHQLTVQGGCATDTGYGGGIALSGFGTHLLGTELTVQNNAATYGGGISVQDGARLELVTGDVSSNLAVDGGGIWGGIDSDLVIGSLADATSYMTANDALGSGGGIYAPDELALVNTQLVSNTAGDNGGGVFMSGVAGMEGVSFQNNAANDGGGLYLASGQCSTNDLIFNGNVAAANGGGAWIGGVASWFNVSLYSNIAPQGSTAFIQGVGDLLYSINPFGGGGSGLESIYCDDFGNAFSPIGYTHCNAYECTP